MYGVIAWHGESRSVFYVVDWSAPEDERPRYANVACANRDEAEALAADLNRRRQ